MSTTPTRNAPLRTDTKPWWRYGMVWLVVGGPAVVVVAALATAVIAVRTADEIVMDPVVIKGASATPTAQQPALIARNHAATPKP
ncbi:hypothetical protein BurJ1DRAFT_3498 [Burkholderiales bacterium JOSHI_001]|nr:hypothetical protein BurJ1DRAFT_3498 [Burkholderiales bacterium JOSHI_001]